MSAPDTILRLIDRFDRNKDEYKNPGYNETQLRREFLDPFFGALGWDVENKQGYAEAYKEVVHEDAIKVGSATKAPDYSFRIGGMRKFFVEAKKPYTNLKEDVSPAFQLRRYAWSAKLPLSILTDFEEFVVYDCRIKPVHTDKSSTARTLYLPYTDYERQWDEIYNIFSHEAVLKGSFDKYAETNRLKKGTAEVDDAFLKEIESWRDTLARTIALRNTKLTQRELNFAVQRTIDRIIFLRICEDRGVETYGTLMALQNGERVYKKLCEIFYRADEKYNSGLFHFQQEKGRPETPDELTLTLDIDDKPLKEIIKGLYYPDSPYEFSVLPADILGQVYEQFLGKVIRLTEGHRAVVEDKPEVKKAGGVYYTPTYIVEYIVKNTVGKLLEGKTPNQVTKLHILDPACGSGSFLIGAYQHLLDWHRDWYVKDGIDKWTQGRKATLYQGQGGDWRLTTSERKRILLNNIYGVDIDTQAVEVTKLSLLLKVLEGENEQTLSSQLKLFHERALPDLGDNIKCGNSLIGPDFYDGQQLSLLDGVERLRINAFDWNKEFAEIMKGGGFDTVIGNPPYIRMLIVDKSELVYMSNKYSSATGHFDIYVLFIEKTRILVKHNGRVGMIVPSKFLQANYGRGLKDILLRDKHLESFVDFKDYQIFKNASTYTCVPIFDYSNAYDNITIITPKDNRSVALINDTKNINDNYFLYDSALESITFNLGTFQKQELRDIENRLSHLGITTLEDCCEKIFQGLATTADPVFTFDLVKEKKSTYIGFSKSIGANFEVEKNICKKLAKGSDIKRYRLISPSKYFIFPYIIANDKANVIQYDEMKNNYPLALSYLKMNKDLLDKREHGKMIVRKDWYAYSQEHNLNYFEREKIITQVLAKRASFTIDKEKDIYFVGGGNAGGYAIVPKRLEMIKYYLALLNSRLFDYLLQSRSSRFRGGYYSYARRFIGVLPILETQSQIQDSFTSLVDKIMGLNREFGYSKNPHDNTFVIKEIDAIEKQIDTLVYELYGLTEKEIKIVEGEGQKIIKN